MTWLDRVFVVCFVATLAIGGATMVLGADEPAGASDTAPSGDSASNNRSDDADREEKELANVPSAGNLSRNEVLLASLTIFVLAVFVGFEVITKVPPTLHTPLMSGSNAISGITLVGAVLATASAGFWVPLLGLIAILLATVNVVGGFLVTHRMLSMFKRKPG